MTKLPILAYKDVEKVLKKVGFVPAPKRGKGSHLAYYRVDSKGHKALVIVPRTKSIPRGTLLSILKQADLSREEFLAELE